MVDTTNQNSKKGSNLQVQPPNWVVRLRYSLQLRSHASMKSLRLHTQDATLPSPHALAAIGAVWRCIVPDARGRAEFLARDGIDALAVLLERGNRHIRCAPF